MSRSLADHSRASLNQCTAQLTSWRWSRFFSHSKRSSIIMLIGQFNIWESQWENMIFLGQSWQSAGKLLPCPWEWELYGQVILVLIKHNHSHQAALSLSLTWSNYNCFFHFWFLIFLNCQISSSDRLIISIKSFQLEVAEKINLKN